MGDASTRGREQANKAGRAPSSAAHDRRGALVQLDLLVRTHPDPEALLEGLRELRKRGELSDDDLPELEATLMGLVSPRARPNSDPTRPSSFAALPPEEQARLRDLMQADLDHLAARADEVVLGAADERDVCTTLERWVALDEQQGLCGTLLDQFLLGLGHLRLTRGLAGAVTNPLDELKRRVSPEGRARLVRALSKGRALGQLAHQQPAELPTVWRDVLVKTAYGLPGGAASFAGGALQSLPTDYADRAGEWLKAQGVDSLREAGYSEDDAADVVTAGSVAGRAWGEGMQLVAGVGAMGEAAKLGKLAKLGVTGARAAEVAETLQGVVGLAEDVNKLLTVTGPLLVGAFKVFTDLLKKAARGEEIRPEDVTMALASRAVKELLSTLSEGDAETGTKAAEGRAYDDKLTYGRERDEANDRAAGHGERAMALRQESPTRESPKERARSDRRANEHDRTAKVETARAKELGGRSLDSLASYLVYAVVRRLLTNLASELTKALAREASRKEPMLAREGLVDDWGLLALKIVGDTAREVATEVLTNKLMKENGLFAAMPPGVQETVKLGIDGVTKILAGYLERAWNAIATP